MQPAGQVNLNMITYPPGWTLAAWRASSQTNAAGAIIQGVTLTLRAPSGSTVPYFVPFNLLATPSGLAAIEAGIAELVGGLGALGAS